MAAHALLAQGWIIAAPAIAQTPEASEPAPASLRVSGAACLERSAVEDQVHARSSRIDFVPASPSIPHLNVTLQRNPGRTLAVELAVAWPNGKRSRRRLAANSCDEATSAVAFLIALTLDPASVVPPGADRRADGAASSSPPSEASERAEGAGPSDETRSDDPTTTNAAGAQGPAGDSGQGAPLAETARGTGPTGHDAPSAARDSNTPTTPADADSGANDSDPSAFVLDHVSLGLGAQVALGVAPRAMTGLAVQVMLALYRRGLWAPALQLSAAHVWAGGLAQPGGVADFQQSTLRIDVCPVGLSASVFAARACLASALGSLAAQGSRSYAPRSNARLWLDLGASLLASADLGSLFQVLGGVTLAMPLRRDRFAFRPDVFHRVAPLGWEGHLGLGVRFP